MTLAGKRIAMLVEQDFEDSELAEPMRALRQAGATIVLVGSGSQSTYRGKHGTVAVAADATAEGVRGRDFDAVIIPGGHAPDRMRLHQAMVDLVREAFQAGKLVAAICHGPQLLISAEVVRGKRLTCYPSIAVDVKNAGGRYVDEPVVRDGNLITSRRPDDLELFNQAIVDALGCAKEAGR